MPAPASVVIAARDAAATLGATLNALAKQDLGEPFEVIVVDDGSRDATSEIARSSPIVSSVLRQEGAGPGAARNHGAAAATGDVLAFTDADCEPEPGWLRAGLDAIAAGADLVQGRVVPARPAGPFDRTVWVERLTHLYETANLLVRRERFETAGGFESWLLPGFSKELGEDVWLGWRIARAGARVEFVPEAVVRHAVFARGPGGYVAERMRRRFFPALAARIPELREDFLHRRWFLNSRTAAFDLAVVAGAVALAFGVLPALLAVVPYARVALHDARHWGLGRAVLVAPVQLAADVVSLGALLYGSVRSRALVI